MLPEVQAYDCAGIEWFAWITDLVWVRVILARIAETSEATSDPRSLSAELSAKTSPQTIASAKPNPYYKKENHESHDFACSKRVSADFRSNGQGACGDVDARFRHT